jgi:hypothetical protein
MIGLSIVGALLVGGGAWAGLRLVNGGEVTPVSLDEAIDRYRDQVTTTEPSAVSSPAVSTESSTESSTASSTESSTGAPEQPTEPPSSVVDPAPSPRLADPGVYTYATEGFDEVDALTGARHDYPSLTTITVTPHGCGVRLRWDVAVERWDSWDWCLEAGSIRMDGWTAYHEFFGVAGKNEYVCEGDARPLDAAPATTWTVVCRNGDLDTSTFVATVVDRGPLLIGGESIGSLHVHADVAASGVSTGTQSIDSWYSIDTGMLLREQLVTMTEQDTPIGSTSFEERYSIELTSIRPQG